MTCEILKLSVSEILKLYKKKSLSPVDVAQVSFKQISKFNPEFNAFALVADEVSIISSAKESEDRWFDNTPQGALDGIPVTIKDGADVSGWPTREGSLTTSDKPKDSDALFVSNLRKSGAIFIGKTTTPEYGHKGVTDSKIYGITRNPWNAKKTSGGSSGGAAVAAATRMGLLHHGTDGGGSIRIPASFCGVFGMKPTQGIISGSMPSLFTSMASSGVLATSVENAALMLDVMAEPNINDWDCHLLNERLFANKLSKPLKKLKIAYAPSLNNIAVDDDISSVVKEAIDKIGDIADIEEIDFKIPNLSEVFSKHWMAVAYWLREQFDKNKQKSIDKYLLSWAKLGSEMPLKDYLDAELGRLNIIEEVKSIFTKYDAILMPTMPLVAFEAGRDMPIINGEDYEDWTPFTFLANLAKLPAASLPCGFSKDGLPVGLQIISSHLNDSLVLSISKILEERIGFKNWTSNNFNEALNLNDK